MSRLEHQFLNSPLGYASYVDKTSLPENRAQLISGFFPARFGNMYQVPQLRQCLSVAYDIVAAFPYYSADGSHDKLVIIRSNSATAGQLYTTPLTGAFSYNAYNGNQHVKLTLAAPSLVGNLAPQTGSLLSALVFAVPVQAVRAVQFNDELIIFDATPVATGPTGGVGAILRYYVDSSGVEHLEGFAYSPVSLVFPFPFAGISDGGAGVLGAGTYKYALARLDEKGREGEIARTNSAGADLDITYVTAGHQTLFSAGITANSTYPVNVYRTVANGAVFLLAATLVGNTPYTDNVADVDLGDAMPEIGENDPPLGATFGAAYKDRLVINARQTPPIGPNFPAGNVGGNQVIQISNAGSPTQFSVISLPTNPSDGLTIGVGTSTGDQVTGLANLGSLLAIFMGRSIKLLQGQDGTDFEAVEIHKRGCLNHDSIQRAENVIPFLSNDGVYEIAYGSGIQDRKISLDVEDFFFADADTVGNGNESDFVKRIMAAANTGSLYGWYWQNYYFLSMPMETLVYDLVDEGWAQTGWGLISNAAVYTKTGSPQACFVLQRSDASVKPRKIYWFSDEQLPDDPDALPTSDAIVITRPFDGGGPSVERTKRAHRFTLFGTAQVPDGTKVGTVTLITDTGYHEIEDLNYRQVIGQTDAMYETEFNRAGFGRRIWIEIRVTDPTVVLSQIGLSYSSWDFDG